MHKNDEDFNDPSIASEVDTAADFVYDPTTAKDAGFGEIMMAAIETAKRTMHEREVAKTKSDETVEQIRCSEPNIVKRAKALVAAQAISFKSIRRAPGDSMATKPVNCDSNRWCVFDALFGNGGNRPHLNTFSGRIVDHEGTIIDDRYPIMELVHAIEATGLTDQRADQVRRSLKEFALHVQSNDLIKRVEKLVPQWDEKERLESELIERFACFDTTLNRNFSKYFWLSLYCRAMHPGCYAPMVLTLIGAQNSGKSYFAKRIVQIITGEDGADSVQLDLSGEKNAFLREITGHSIIASIGEMTGFGRGDMNKIKAFVTQTADPMHYKYEGNFTQQRQWIAIMDGNRYEGLQRDETGNRRFYPMFVGQIEDSDGQPQWRESFTANFDGFDETIWQIIAECRNWLNENEGIAGYEEFTRKVVADVSIFSREEMKGNRGTIADPELDLYFLKALRKCDKRPYQRRGSDRRKGVIVMQDDFATAYKAVSRINRTLNLKHLDTKMSAAGAECGTYANARKGFFFPEYEDVDQMHASMDTKETSEGIFGDLVKGGEPEF